MATIYYKIFKHHKKKDGKYNVKYCLTHKGKQVYYASTHHVSESQIKKDLTIKDRTVLDAVYSDIKQMEHRLSALGIGADRLSASDLLKSITANAEVQGIDFIAFSRSHLDQLRKEGREGTANSMRPGLNNLTDYLGTDSADIKSITSVMLRGFEKHLKSDRRIVRINQFADEVITNRKGLGPAGIHNNMRTIRILFNECRRVYNTEFSTPISHYPFDYYKVPPPPKARKRGNDVGVEQIRAIRDMEARPGSRKELARDMFMLSFYLCGINVKDLYDQKWSLSDGRIGYGRSKTSGRSDAFISVAVPQQAGELLDKYSKKVLHRRYANHGTILTAISKGMDEISEGLGIKVTFYHARHTFATLARNECGFSKDDIAEALNHASGHKVTDRYIAEDWSVVDRVQAGVLGLLAGNDLIQVRPVLPQ